MLHAFTQATIMRPSCNPLLFDPSWTAIGLLRAASSVAIWEACGRDLVSMPLIVMMLHLSIGDAW